MKHDAEALYRRWLSLYDAGDPDAAMEMTTAQFSMLAPDGTRLDRQAALKMTQQMKGYIEAQGLKRKTEVLSLHVVPVNDDHAVVHAQVELSLTPPQSEQPPLKLRFAEVIHVGPEGIAFDAFSRLSDAQGLL